MHTRLPVSLLQGHGKLVTGLIFSRRLIISRFGNLWTLFGYYGTAKVLGAQDVSLQHLTGIKEAAKPLHAAVVQISNTFVHEQVVAVTSQADFKICAKWTHFFGLSVSKVSPPFTPCTSAEWLAIFGQGNKPVLLKQLKDVPAAGFSSLGAKMNELANATILLPESQSFGRNLTNPSSIL